MSGNRVILEIKRHSLTLLVLSYLDELIKRQRGLRALALVIKGSHRLATHIKDSDGDFLRRKTENTFMEAEDSHSPRSSVPPASRHYPSVPCFTCSSSETIAWPPSSHPEVPSSGHTQGPLSVCV